MSEQTADPRCVPLTIHTYGLTNKAWNNLFDRVATAAHANDEQLFTASTGSCRQCEDPDWADLREMARGAGYTHRKLARDWLVWTDKDVYIELRRRYVGGWRITVTGEFGDVALNDPTPARVLNIARELGIGGTS